ncbi:MAG: MBL fold metallo-hydrolase [Bryobacterales bacterium]|nr:MBL fold metallo-hydrolase [Bryobacterales bacterium]
MEENLLIEFQPEGIHLPSQDFWLDPGRPVDSAWISHAHSDHACAAHGSAWGTPQTLAIYDVRWPGTPEDVEKRTSVGYGRQFSVGEVLCTVLPAAHILGAAQLLIEYRGERVVYTGDIKYRAPLCGVRTEIAPCDRLIIECTFGLPIYSFLEREEAAARIAAFARECLDGGITPVFYGYPLGRGQEIVHVLSGAGIPVAVHGAIARYIPFYEQAGYGFGAWEPYETGRMKGRALVVTPSMRNLLEASGGGKFRAAYVSGWAALANARARTGAEELIPYSDHADYSELLAMIEQSGARRVDLVHGYTAPFARLLRQRGIDARAAGAETGAMQTAGEA